MSGKAAKMTSKKSYILAGAVALGVTAWMLSDNIFGSAPTAEAEIELSLIHISEPTRPY